jgi:hypothetical protein
VQGGLKYVRIIHAKITIDLWTPVSAGAALLPVMVMIAPFL